LVNMISLMDFIAFISSLVSLILAVFAIWLAKDQKREADQINRDTRDLLLDIRTDAKTISNVAMPELKAYGDTAREVIIEKLRSPIKSAFDDNNDDLFSEIITRLKEIKSGKIDGSLREQISNIERTIESSAKEKLPIDVESGVVLVDLTDIKEGYKEITYNKNHKFLYFIEMIFYELLEAKLPPKSYGIKWELVDSQTNEKVANSDALELDKRCGELLSTDIVYKLVVY
jgi:hypothetical protein